MKWLELDVLKESSPAWFEIPPDVRGHHRALAIFCAREENGGLLENASKWGSRQWWAVAGVSRRDVDRLVTYGLAKWRDSESTEHGARSLELGAYPRALEHWVRAERERKHKRPKSKGAQGVNSAESPRTVPGASADGTGTVQVGSGSGSGSGSIRRPDGDQPATTTPPAPRSGGGGGFAEGEGDVGAGPEGFEAFWERHPKASPWLRERALELWVDRDLEGEAEAIINYVGNPPPHWRRELGRFATNPIEFLRRGEWRKRRLRKPPPRPAAPPIEVYVPAPWPGQKATRSEIKEHLRRATDKEGLS